MDWDCRRGGIMGHCVEKGLTGGRLSATLDLGGACRDVRYHGILNFEELPYGEDQKT
jgi:hypothetical protein